MMPVILKEDDMQSYLSNRMSLEEFNEDSYLDDIEFMKSRR